LRTLASHQPKPSDGKRVDALSMRNNTSAAISECRFKLTSLAVKVKNFVEVKANKKTPV